MPQPSLPFSGRSATSRATSLTAARDASHVAGHQAQAVLRVIRESGTRGVTDWDIIAATGIQRSSVCARRNALMNAKPQPLVVERPGYAHERSRRSGPWQRECTVYVTREAAEQITSGRAA